MSAGSLTADVLGGVINQNTLHSGFGTTGVHHHRGEEVGRDGVIDAAGDPGAELQQTGVTGEQGDDGREVIGGEGLMQDMDGISQLEGQESVDGEDVAPLGQAFGEVQLLARRNEFIGVVVGCA